MPRFYPGPGRERLGFREAVYTHFEFMVSELGFSIVSASSTLIRFESERTVVNVFHGRGSYILGVEIGLRPSDDQREIRYSLRDIIAISDDAESSEYYDYQVSSAEHLDRFVALLAAATRQYALDALRGDQEVFPRLAAYVRSQSIKNTEAFVALDLREKADKSWREKNLQEVVNAYEALSRLSTVELKRSELARLKYAGRHLIA